MSRKDDPREDGETYRLLCESMPYGVVFQDADGRITSANPAALDILGLAWDRICGGTSMDPDSKAIHEDGSAFPRESHPGMEAVRIGMPVRDIRMGVFNPKEKRVRWISIEAVPFFRPGNTRPFQVCIIFRDISERKEIENALRVREKEFRTLAENFPDIIARFDRGFRHTYINPVIQAVTGIPAVKFLGKTRREMGFPEERVALWESQLSKVFESGERAAFEFDYESPDRTRHFSCLLVPELDDGGMVESVIAVVRDVTDHKDAMEAIRANEKRYRILVEALQEGIWAIDAEGTTTFVSPRLAEMLGYHVDEMLGVSFSVFLDPSDEKFSIAFLERCEIRFKRKDGSHILTELSITPFDGDQGIFAGAIASVLDISGRKQAEEAYRSLVENSLQGFAIIQDGRIVFGNRALSELSGYSLNDLFALSSREVEEVVHPDDRDRVLQMMGERLAGKDVSALQEFRFIRKNGSICWAETLAVRIDFRGKTALQVSYMDVTEKKLDHENLMASEKRYRELFDGVGNCVIVYVAIGDGADFVIRDFNPAAERVEGFSKAEVVGRRATEVFPGIRDMGLLDVFQGVWKTGMPAHLGPSFYKDARHEGWRENHVYRLPSGEVVAVYDDITVRKRVEKELVDSRAQLRNLATHLLSAREEERRKVAREIHDELGQVLTALKIDLKWLEKRIEPSLDKLRDKVEGMIGLTDQTIQRVQKISAELRPRMLDDLGLAAAIDWLARDFSRRTGIACMVREDIGKMRIDGERATALFRIIQEALTNVARHAQASQVALDMRETQGRIEVSIQDDGVGISEKQAMDPLSMGLIGIRERILVFGGEVSIKGEKGKGTGIRVAIPLPRDGAPV